MKEGDYKELIERLKQPGYLEKFLHLFQDTPRLRTVPSMIEKRIGLFDGRIWQYNEIGLSTIPFVTYIKCGCEKLADKRNGVSSERVRQRLMNAYKLILENEPVNQNNTIL